MDEQAQKTSKLHCCLFFCALVKTVMIKDTDYSSVPPGLCGTRSWARCQLWAPFGYGSQMLHDRKWTFFKYQKKTLVRKLTDGVISSCAVWLHRRFLVVDSCLARILSWTAREIFRWLSLPFVCLEIRTEIRTGVKLVAGRAHRRSAMLGVPEGGCVARATGGPTAEGKWLRMVQRWSWARIWLLVKNIFGEHLVTLHSDT